MKFSIILYIRFVSILIRIEQSCHALIHSLRDSASIISPYLSFRQSGTV